jgi:hypothetical protein
MNQLPSGWRFRTNWRGQMILQRRHRELGGYPGDWILVWRDATVEDLHVLFSE